ncbi:helix-turn-helix domain-containing protein [Phorcysia thermohydrogeniphila]|uniref:Transcriptional regulator n=1 Tax=Phorcysia thermohydrogeniphila TaxID=936138 RepID=A0A4R1GFG9_9BACT|nr:helix-turn-helix domain-containing protein [Phorcysia thermohydrogeniphila]TCK04569.1 transcriptional regulator [Phorcysia thermohydrogeniphila]
MKRVCAIGIPNDDEDLQSLLEGFSPLKELSFYVEPVDTVPTRELADFIDLLAISPSKKNLPLIDHAVESLNLPVVVVLPFRGKEKLLENIYPYINRESALILVTYSGELFVKTGIKLIVRISNKLKLEVRSKEFLQLRLSPNCSHLEKFKAKKLLRRNSLSFKEALMLKLFFESPGEVIPYERFLELGIKEDSLPVYISKLRRMLKCLEPSVVIRSNRKNGYTLTQGL